MCQTEGNNFDGGMWNFPAILMLQKKNIYNQEHRSMLGAHKSTNSAALEDIPPIVNTDVVGNLSK